MRAFSGIWVPVVTPFAADGSVDVVGLAALVRRLVEAGIHGLIALTYLLWPKKAPAKERRMATRR